MPEIAFTKVFYGHDRCLIVHVANLEHGLVSPNLPEATVEEIFDELSPQLTERRCELAIHDLPEQTIDGRYPDGSLEGLQAVRIGVPEWPVQEEMLSHTIAYFLHLMTRWQQFDLPYTLGEELAAVGMALQFAARHSSWTPPWAEGGLPPAIYRRARKAWDNKEYDHTDWFMPEETDNLGYALAFELTGRYLGNRFSVRESIKTTAADLWPLVDDAT